MNIPLNLRDDAVGEGLLAAELALKSFDPSRGVPLQAWLILKTRYAVRTLIRHEFSIWNSCEYDEEGVPSKLEQIPEPAYTPQPALYQAVVTILRGLGPIGDVVFMCADGMPRCEISRKYKRTGMSIERMRVAGMLWLRESLKDTGLI